MVEHRNELMHVHQRSFREVKSCHKPEFYDKVTAVRQEGCIFLCCKKILDSSVEAISAKARGTGRNNSKSNAIDKRISDMNKIKSDVM